MRSEVSATVLPMHTRCPYPNGSEANGSNAEELSSHLDTSWSPVQGAGVSPVRVELVRLGEVLLHPGGEAGVGDHHGARGDAVAAEHRVLLTTCDTWHVTRDPVPGSAGARWPLTLGAA